MIHYFKLLSAWTEYFFKLKIVFWEIGILTFLIIYAIISKFADQPNLYYAEYFPSFKLIVTAQFYYPFPPSHPNFSPYHSGANHLNDYLLDGNHRMARHY